MMRYGEVIVAQNFLLSIYNRTKIAVTVTIRICHSPMALWSDDDDDQQK